MSALCEREDCDELHGSLRCARLCALPWPFIWTSFRQLDWRTFARVLGKLPVEDAAELGLPKRIPKWLRRDRFVPTARVVRR